MNLFKKPIRTRADIVNYIDFLQSKGMMYHFDDDASEILSNSTTMTGFSVRLFTDEECILVDRRRDEMLDMDYDFVFEYLMHSQTVEDLFV